MGGEQFLASAPDRAEAAVPHLQPAVGREHADRFEQIVEGRGAHAQQRVARARQLDLLGAILEDQQQSAIGKRLGIDAQMRAVLQQPILLQRLGRQEPVAPLRPPGREIAMFGQTARIAHLVEYAFEQWRIGQGVLAQAEKADEGLVPEAQRPVGAEARHTSGEAIEQIALGRFEPAALDPRLLQLMLVDRIAGYPRLAQRHVDHAHHAPFPIDGGGHHAFDQFVARHRVGGRGLGRHAAHRFDQLDTLGDDIPRILRIDCTDIGAVDQAEPQVRRAMPHWKGRSFDQPGQRLQRLPQLLHLGAQRLDFRLAVGRVEDPQHDAAAFRKIGPRRRAAHEQQAGGAKTPDRQGEALPRSLRGSDFARERLRVLRLDPAVLGREFRQKIGRAGLAQPFGEPVGGFQPTIGMDDDRSGRRGGEQHGQPIEPALRMRAFAPHALAAHQRPDRSAQPERQNDAQDDGGNRRQRRHRRPPLIRRTCPSLVIVATDLSQFGRSGKRAAQKIRASPRTLNEKGEGVAASPFFRSRS